MKRLAIAFILLLACAAARAGAAQPPAVVVIGIDGMDPVLLERFVEEGRMPNFRRLMEEGSFRRLETSIPPQSPVAWSNFITGMDPGGHGIFDFIHRDPATYAPTFSAADVIEPGRTLALGDWILPLSAGGTRLLRRGDAFWQVLDRHGVPCTVIRVPANYPPAPTKSRTLSGMGTPDLLGTYGTFAFYTDDPAWEGASAGGGRIHAVTRERGRVRTVIEGPPNTLRRSRPVLTRELVVDVDADNGAARIIVGDEERLLRPGEWSDWVAFDFDLVPPFRSLRGMCRFFLGSVAPLRLYASPVNIDPEKPALPISTPPGYARDLARRIGRFATLGIAEDTKALEAGVFSDAEFVTQTDTLMAERDRMLDAVLDDFDRGFLFFYVSSIDQSCHALWRNADPVHPAHADADTSFAGRFGDLYERMDALLGRVRARIPADAAVIVLSDHGFAPFYHKVHLNTWLAREGYLALVRPEDTGQPLFGNVFWRRTRAYAAGLNGLYVNLVGRESKGIVAPGAEYDALLADLESRLLALRDPETGEAMVSRVYRARDVYHGAEAAHAPDLIVGYNRGYRSSDDSALGTVTAELVTPNLGKWTGDHCMDHTLVPGVLVTSLPVSAADPALVDLPVSILALFGVEAPAQMRGRSLFGAP